MVIRNGSEPARMEIVEGNTVESPVVLGECPKVDEPTC